MRFGVCEGRAQAAEPYVPIMTLIHFPVLSRVATRRALCALLLALLMVSGAARAQRLDFDPHDLQGTWTNDTATPLQRPAEFAGRDKFTAEEAAEYERGLLDRALKNLPSAEDRALQIDFNDTYVDAKKVDRLRTSLIIVPPDGRLPPRADAAKTRPRQTRSTDDPESLTLNERCLGGGVPYAPGPLGSGIYEIVQAGDHVMIVAEAMHNARVIRLNGTHLPAGIRQWLGDSIGHWKGTTLVVDTTNFRPETRFQGSGERLHVVERFTRISKDTIEYRFTADDPDTWTTAWTAEVLFRSSDVRMFESACHEGDYDRELILRAARVQEQQQRREAGSPR
jgi:hypothetical protein